MATNTLRDMKFHKDWYEFERVDDGLTLVRERFVADWLRCNMWLIHGRDRDLLVDAGLGLTPLKPCLAEISERDCVAVMTHCHFDHIGAASEFDQRLGHESEAHIHASPDNDNTGGAADFIRAETFHALPHEGYDFSDFKIKPAPLTGHLDEGDRLDLGNRSLQVFHLPGHSPGSIALYESTSRTLFSGDVVYDGDLYDQLYHSDRALYRESLRRLRDLPVDTVHAGHYSSFDRPRLHQIIDDYLDGGGTLGQAGSWVQAQINQSHNDQKN